MTDKPRGRIRSALLDVLAPPADDLAVVRPDSDPWSTPAGVAPGADLERVQDADLSARAHVVPFESYLDQQPRAAVPFAIDAAPPPVGQKAAGFVAQALSCDNTTATFTMAANGDSGIFSGLGCRAATAHPLPSPAPSVTASADRWPLLLGAP